MVHLPPLQKPGWRLVVPWLGTPNAAWFQTLWALMQPWQHAIRASNGHLWWCTMVVEMWTNRKRAPWKEASWSRWWFQIFLIFTSKIGEMMQFDEHIFQVGGVEPPTSDPCFPFGVAKGRVFSEGKSCCWFQVAVGSPGQSNTSWGLVFGPQTFIVPKTSFPPDVSRDVQAWYNRPFFVQPLNWSLSVFFVSGVDVDWRIWP